MAQRPMLPPWAQGGTGRPVDPFGLGRLNPAAPQATPESLGQPRLPPSPLAGLAASRGPRPLSAPPDPVTYNQSPFGNSMPGEGVPPAFEDGVSYRGPRLNTAGALSGLRAASQPSQLLPDSELHRIVDPRRGMIPASSGNAFFGGNEAMSGRGLGSSYWGGILDARQAEDKARMTFDRGQTELAEKAIMETRPPVQTALEAQARRAAYPQQVAGRAAIESANIGAVGRLGAAQATAGGRRSARDATMGSQALRQLRLAQQGFSGQDPEEQKQQVAFWQELLNQIGRGQFFDEDLMEDENLTDEDY